MALLGVYSLLTNLLLLLSLIFLLGGFVAIGRYGTCPSPQAASCSFPRQTADVVATEPFEIGGKVITPQNLYVGLFVVGECLRSNRHVLYMAGEAASEADARGIPLLWFAAPLSTFFWLVGSSGCLVGAHAGLIEPGIES